jgi:hypothetical protein
MLISNIDLTTAPLRHDLVMQPLYCVFQWGHSNSTIAQFGAFLPPSLCTSSAFALAWRNYSPRSITPRFCERFCVPLRLGANWGYWPSDSDSTREEESITSYSCFSLGWGLACHWHRHQVQGASVLCLLRRTRAREQSK